MVRWPPRGEMFKRGHPAATSPTRGLAPACSLVLAAESNCSSFTPGEVEACEEVPPKIEEPRPDVMEDKPQPASRIVNSPPRHTRVPARATNIAECVI